VNTTGKERRTRQSQKQSQKQSSVSPADKAEMYFYQDVDYAVCWICFLFWCCCDVVLSGFAVVFYGS